MRTGNSNCRQTGILIVADQLYQHPDKPGPDTVHSGAYDDEFRKTDQGWKFSRRVIQFDHQ